MDDAQRASPGNERLPAEGTGAETEASPEPPRDPEEDSAPPAAGEGMGADVAGQTPAEPAVTAPAEVIAPAEATAPAVPVAEVVAAAAEAATAQGRREVLAHAVAETRPPTDDEAAAGLDAVESDAAAESDGQPAVGEGREVPERLKSIIESLLFASDKPLATKRLQELTGERDLEKVQSALEFLRADYADRGVVLHEVAGGFQFRTSPLNAYWVQQMLAGKPVRLTRAQLETLAIVAYRQPITRPEIDDIRGVDSAGPVKILLDRHLVRVLGKKEEPGRPLLYGTTREFLEFFNLKDLRDLPTLREFAELSEESMAKVRSLDEQREP